MKKWALVNKISGIIEGIVESPIQPSYSIYFVKDLEGKESFNPIGTIYTDTNIPAGPQLVVDLTDKTIPLTLPAKITKLTPTEFKMQFTPEERVAVREFRNKTNDENSTIAYYANLIDDSMTLLDQSTFVYLDNPQVQSLVLSLVDMGILANTERANKILEGF